MCRIYSVQHTKLADWVWCMSPARLESLQIAHFKLKFTVNFVHSIFDFACLEFNFDILCMPLGWKNSIISCCPLLFIVWRKVYFFVFCEFLNIENNLVQITKSDYRFTVIVILIKWSYDAYNKDLLSYYKYCATALKRSMFGSKYCKIWKI